MNTKPFCHYFARGECRFGSHCRNSHDMTGYQGQQGYSQPPHGGSIIGASHFSPQGQASGGSGPAKVPFDNLQFREKAEMIEKSIQKDMKDWDDENIWLFSCYGPIGFKPCLPLFDDLSEEEIRYETLMNGGTIPGSLKIQERVEQARQMKLKLSHLSTGSQEFKNMIEELIRLPDSSGQKPVGSIFGGTTPVAQGNSSFGSSIFGGHTAVAAGPFQNSGAGSFLGSASPAPAATFFQGGTGFSMGITPVPAPAPTALSSFSFALPAQGQVQGQSIGMGAQPVPNTNVGFQQGASGVGTFTSFTPSAGVGFSLPSAAPSPFATLPTTNPQPSSIFGNSPSVLQPQQPRPLGFGQPAPPSVSDLVNYSRVEDLTPEELKAFEADSFDDFFPMKLPPKHLCI